MAAGSTGQGTTRAGALFGVFLLLFAGACGEQAFVSYQGSVTEADEQGYAFGDREREDRTPIPGATVSLCEEEKCRAVVDDAGNWGPIWQGFGLFGGTHHVDVRVEAPGHRAFTYQTDYPSGNDPFFGEQPLDVKLQREGLVAVDGGLDAEAVPVTDGSSDGPSDGPSDARSDAPLEGSVGLVDAFVPGK